VCVGVILCGQKRLEGDEDLIGDALMEQFAEKQGLKDLVPELREQRLKCPTVSRQGMDEIKRLLWATSQFVSQVLYNKLDQDTTGPDSAGPAAVDELFAQFGRLGGDRTNPQSFWTALSKHLDALSRVFECRGVAVVLENDGQLRVVSSSGLGLSTTQIPADESLITAQVRTLAGPGHVAITSDSMSQCYVSSRVLRQFPRVNMVLFDKAKMGESRQLHFLVYFDPTLPRHNALLLHQKKQILGQFVRETANWFTHLERIEQLQTALRNQDALLKDIVHQINQPLHGILADCENLISEKYPMDRKARIVKYLPQRAKQISVLVKCVQYAAGQKGMLEALRYVPTPQDLTKLLIEGAIDLQGYSEAQHVRIEVDRPSSDALGSVMIDKEHVGMALSNVLFNAVKYSFPGTRITVRAERDLVSQSILILVTNCGVAIHESEKEFVFSKGARTRLAKSFSQSGLGIGLFVTRELLRKMGGGAYVRESSVTGGRYKQFDEYRTTITLALPQTVLLADRR
jgi:signal transduction histidine kinase